MKNPLYCSFCGKRDTEVDILIAGPTVFICDKCVDDCADIISRRRAEKLSAGEREYLSWRAA